MLLLLALPAALAVPTNEQTVLAGVEAIAEAIGGPFVDIGGSLKHVFDDVLGAKESVAKWIDDGKQFVKQNGLICECSFIRRTVLSTETVLQTSSSRIRRSSSINCALPSRTFAIRLCSNIQVILILPKTSICSFGQFSSFYCK